MTKKSNSILKGRLRGFRRPLAGVVGALLFLAAFGGFSLRFHFHRVSTPVMTPGVAQGEITIVDTSVAGDRVRYGSIVLIDGSQWPGGPAGFQYVFRVVGMGGDIISCESGGRLTRNGRPIAEPYARGDTAAYGAFQVRVPDDRLFVLGDSREIAADSRIHLGDPGQGTVAKTAVRGEVSAIAWPPLQWRRITQDKLLMAEVFIALLGLALAGYGAGIALRNRRSGRPLPVRLAA